MLPSTSRTGEDGAQPTWRGINFEPGDLCSAPSCLPPVRYRISTVHGGEAMKGIPAFLLDLEEALL
jgi:hypothetical protein